MADDAEKPDEPNETPQDAGNAGPLNIDQNTIDSMLGSGDPPGDSSASNAPTASGDGSSVSEGINPDDIELLLQQAEAALASVEDPSGETPAGVQRFQLQNFAGAPPTKESASLQLLSDVQLDVKIELGRTHMHLEDVLKLHKGAVVPLDKLAGDPVDVYVNGRLIARGEVLVLNDNFCVRLAELVVGEAVEAQ